MADHTATGTTGSASPADQLRLGWREHRPYVLVSVALFALGIVGGIAMIALEVDLFALLGIESAEDLFGEDVELTVRFILANNTRAFLAFAVLGPPTIGLVTVLGLLFNGLVIGYLVAPIAAEVGLGFVLVALLPHGVFELPALFVAAGVGLRYARVALVLLGQFVHHLLVGLGFDRGLSGVGIDPDRGPEAVVPDRAALRRTGLLVLAAWIVLAIAAVIEVYVTPALLELLYPDAAAETI